MQAEGSVDPKKVVRKAAECYADPVEFCRFFLPHLFPETIPWFHRAILAILTRKCGFLSKYGELDLIEENFVWTDEEDTVHHIFGRDSDGAPVMRIGRFTLLMMPRGFSKTTIAGVAVPLYELLYQDVPFTLYVSHAAAHSNMQLANVKRELMDNDRIRMVFGRLKPELRDEEKWSADFFETTSQMAMAGRGMGGQVRGLIHRGQRPKKIIADDIEDRESVSTDEQREKTRTWFFSDLLPALPRHDKGSTITMLGTILHPDALLETLARDPNWTVVRMSALDRQGSPIWPLMMDEAEIERTKKSFARAGQLHTFYMEFFNVPVAPEQQPFRPEYVEDANKGTEQVCTHYVTYCDPAISQKPGADRSVVCTVGITQRGLIVVEDLWAERGALPRTVVDEYFRQTMKYKSSNNGVESQAFQAALVHILREEMFRKGYYFEIEPVTHKNKKEDRIRGILQARYANGYVRHRKRFPTLDSELMDFPQGAHDDCPDAVAGAVALLDPYAAQAADPTIDLSADEYEPLDMVFGGDWRAH